MTPRHVARHPAVWIALAAAAIVFSVQLERMIRGHDTPRDVSRSVLTRPRNVEPAGQPLAMSADSSLPPVVDPPIDSAIPRVVPRIARVDRSRFAPVGQTRTPIVSAVLAHTGTVAAVLEESGRVTLWDVDLHQRLSSFSTGLPTPITHAPPMALMPPRDLDVTSTPPLLAIGGSDGRIREWQAATGKQTFGAVHGTGEHPIVEVVWAAGGITASVASDGSLELVAVAGQPGAPSLTRPVSPGGAVHDVASSYETGGTVAATASGLYSVEGPFGFWTAIDSSDTSHPVQVIFSPRGSLLASAWSDGEIRVYDVATRARVRTLRIPHGAPGLLAFNGDASLLAASGPGRAIYVWSMTSDTQPVTLRGPRAPVRSMWFAPYDGSLVVVARGDRYLRRLEVPTTR
jgi:hypothetical protein